MIATEARPATRVSLEQRACFEELGHDISDVAVDPAARDAAIEALADALNAGRVAAWAFAIAAIGSLLHDAPAHVCGAARRRLERFVAENADLVPRA